MKRDIKVGDLLRLKGDRVDPWGVQRAVTAKIIDVRDGWVRYNLGYGSDNVMETVKFLGIYE